MLQNLSLRPRILLLLGAVIASGLALGVAALALHAGARIRAEADAATRLARDFLAGALPRIESAAEPHAELSRILAEAQNFRHLRIYVGEEPPALTPRAPAWFAALATPRAAQSRVALDGRGDLKGEIVIAADPGDEIAEIWEEALWLALGGAGVAAVAFLLVSRVVSRTLEPLATLAEGLARLEQGEHCVRVPAGGSPDLVALAERINALAATLARLDEENRTLIQRMVHVQDEERRDIARDLHDEIGPFLFTIRAGVGALARKAQGGAEAAAMAADCGRIDAQIAALQQVNRRILGRLRPAALEEMGLSGALEALAAGWRDSHPQVAIDLDAARIPEPLDEAIALTAYRIVQEGLTNVFRHAGATLVRVRVAPARGADGPALRVTVQDDGAGLGGGAGHGVGLRGMGERVRALGGRLSLTAAAPHGARLDALLPIRRPIREESARPKSHQSRDDAAPSAADSAME